MTRMMAALIAATLMLLASACSSETDDGVASLAEDDNGDAGDDTSDGEGDDDFEEAALAYVECLRENGVDMPDPEFTDEGMVLRRGDGDGSFAVPDAEAQEACQELRPDIGGNFSSEDRAEMQDNALAFAQCMREEGIDFPDPDFSGGGGTAFGGDGAFDPEDPEVQVAFEVCQDEMGGTGPATGGRAG